MAFCKFSSEVIANNKVEINHSFIKEFMPQAPSECTKVYLYGLYLCSNPTSLENTLESVSKILQMSEDDIVSSFLYWQELGLVQILNITPIEVRYMPVKNYSSILKKYNKDKYREFNIQAQEILVGRMITPTEYQEYYHIIESFHMEANALIKIIDYCVNLKSNNVGYNYIATIAKNWAYEGILTEDDVVQRISEQEQNSEEIAIVLKTLGIRRRASTEEYQMFLSWIKDFGFELDTIIAVAKLEKNKTGGMHRLNKTLTKCFERDLLSTKEIEDYYINMTTLFDTAKVVCAKLGVRYDNYENVVDTYINPWFTLGYDTKVLTEIANLCFISGTRTLEGMNHLVNKFFKLGILSSESLDNYLNKSFEHDKQIKEILAELGIRREINAEDRRLYTIWTSTWNISQELILFASKQSADKVQPIQYLNKILSSYYLNKITSVADARSQTPVAQKKVVDNKKKIGREYSAKELNSLFDSVYEVEL